MEIPTGYMQANFRFTGAGVPTGAEIALAYDISEASSDPEDMASNLADDWTTAGIPNLYTSTAAMTSILVKYGPTLTGPSGVWTGSKVGIQAPPQAPPNCAILFRKTTNFGGRSGRGRLYLPAPPDAAIESDGSVGTAYLTTYRLAFADYFLLNLSHNITPVILHSAGAPLTTPTEVTGISMDSRSATQRRRLRR